MYCFVFTLFAQYENPMLLMSIGGHIFILMKIKYSVPMRVFRRVTSGNDATPPLICSSGFRLNMKAYIKHFVAVVLLCLNQESGCLKTTRLVTEVLSRERHCWLWEFFFDHRSLNNQPLKSRDCISMIIMCGVWLCVRTIKLRTTP